MLRHLKVLARSMLDLLPLARESMPALDWGGVCSLALPLQQGSGEGLEDAMCFAVGASVPATLLWLRICRQSQPRLFLMAPD